MTAVSDIRRFGQAQDLPLQITVEILKNSPIRPNSHRTQPHINVGKSDDKQTCPRPEMMFAVQTANAIVSLSASRKF